MKKIYLFLSLVVCFLSGKTQITLDHSTPVAMSNGNFAVGGFLVKLHLNGYKYVTVPFGGNTNQINIYNLNHTLFKSITVPSTYTASGSNYYFISENLFDMDNGVEYLVWKNMGSPTYSTNVSIIDESGAVLFSKDSAGFGGNISSLELTPSIFMNQNSVYYDGLSTKLKLGIYNQYTSGNYVRTEIYNLPGTIPCAVCSSGTLSGISVMPNKSAESPQFYPNPTSDQLKLKYKLPEGSHLAEMKIYDTQGKLVDEFKITDHYDFIYLPTNYNNGLYLYSLIVDGKIIKTEKIVLNK